MITNDQMKPNRYLYMQSAKNLYASIMRELQAGRRIQVTTYIVSKVYSRADQFKMGKSSVYVARGKNWDCIHRSGSTLVSVRSVI